MLEFIIVVLILFFIPGPAVIITITQSLKGGVKAGITTGIGIAVGDLIHTIFAVLGLSAILLTSALAFEIVKYLGVIYLVYIGIRIMFAKQQKQTESNHTKPSTAQSFRQALIIELLNPKTALFFVAFLPQFVVKDGLPIIYQLLILGLTFVLLSIIYTSLLSVLANYIGQKILTKANVESSWRNKLIGTIYIALGLHLMMQNQQ